MGMQGPSRTNCHWPEKHTIALLPVLVWAHTSWSTDRSQGHPRPLPMVARSVLRVGVKQARQPCPALQRVPAGQETAASREQLIVRSISAVTSMVDGASRALGASWAIGTSWLPPSWGNAPPSGTMHGPSLPVPQKPPRQNIGTPSVQTSRSTAGLQAHPSAPAWDADERLDVGLKQVSPLPPQDEVKAIPITSTAVLLVLRFMQ
jgi:hypothetical protein